MNKEAEIAGQKLVLGIDIGTRNVVGTVGYKTDDGEFIVVAQTVREHETRAMIDGQIHDIKRVARVVSNVREELEVQINQPLTDVCIAAAGRVLKTVTCHAEYEYQEEAVVTGEDIHTLNLIGVERAQDILKEKNDTSYKFYCVGYSVVKYYLNEDVFINLEGHKAKKISEDIIVTFLPEDVVDGLYSAVGQAGLNVANLTLEPIAAINVAIPESYRMLNIALVDVGAGTSDICITKEGSITAYGMIPHAGDELTEEIVQHYLVDFQMAEHIKLSSSSDEEVIYEDIMSIEHTISSEDVWQVTDSVVDRMTSEIAKKIKELNGGNSVSATFVVGGGGKIHGFTEKLAEYLELPKERVALRGEEVLKEVTFLQDEIKKDPLLVTPIGICLNYYDQKNNFIMIRFNGERMKLYDNDHLTIVDAALQAGVSNEELFPISGKSITFTVNGVKRSVRGGAGEPAVITLNGKPANINTQLEPNCEVEIIPSKVGKEAVYTISDLEEYTSSSMLITVNEKLINCPKFVEVNGVLEPSSYMIQDGDIIENRGFYTVGQVAEFMDVDVDIDQDIFVNNTLATMDSLVYENFTIDWTVREYLSDDTSYFATEEQIKEKKYQESMAGASIGMGNSYLIEQENMQEDMQENGQVSKKESNQENLQEDKQVQSNNQQNTIKDPIIEKFDVTHYVDVDSYEEAFDEKYEETKSYNKAIASHHDEQEQTVVLDAKVEKKANEFNENIMEKIRTNNAKSNEDISKTANKEVNREIDKEIKKSMDEEEDSSYNGNYGEVSEEVNDATTDKVSDKVTKEVSDVTTDEVNNELKEEPETTTTQEFETDLQDLQEKLQEEKEIIVTVNNNPVKLTDKNSYIFVDIFDKIDFDLNMSRGRGIITTLNGRDARFSEEIHTGDKIEVYWKEI